MTPIPEKLHEYLLQAVEAVGFEFWGAEIITSGKQRILRVYIELPGGVTIDDCTLASRQITSVLMVEQSDYIDYVLEVSSPGMDRLLFTLSQFQRMLGKTVHIRLKHYSPGEQHNFVGEIKLVDEETSIIQIESENGTIQIEFNQIDKAQIVPKF